MTKKRFVLLPAVTAVVAAAIAVGVTALLVNIFRRRTEAKNPFYRVVELNAQPSPEHQPRLPGLPRWDEAELKARVETIQERTFQMRNVVMEGP